MLSKIIEIVFHISFSVINYSRLCESYFYFIPKMKKATMRWEKPVRTLMINRAILQVAKGTYT